MPETLEQRVAQLERKVAEMSDLTPIPTREKNPWRTFGAFKDHPEFEEAVRLGREYREQQTCDKELADS